MLPNQYVSQSHTLSHILGAFAISGVLYPVVKVRNIGLDKSLGYDISEKYEKRLKGTPGEIVRVTLVRLRFSFLFLGFWLVAIIYFAYRLSVPSYCLTSPWFNIPAGIVIFVLVFYAPWVYFNGPVRPRVIWAVVRRTWGREV